MHALHHVVKVITHLMVSHTQWVETAEVKGALKAAKEKIQEALRPGKVPGGSEDENIGVAYEFPDAKVPYPSSTDFLDAYASQGPTLSLTDSLTH